VVRVPGTRPLAGAIALELVDESGKRIAAKYVNVYAHSSSSPRIEVLGPRLVAIRFASQLATRAGDAKVDWPSRQKAVDYPQSEERTYPGTVRIQIGDAPATALSLSDDPADARGFLSSMERYHYANRYASRVSAPALAGDIELRLEGDHGLAVYCEGMGGYGADPVILVHTNRDLSHPTGWRQ
jgi:hypothetical protein